MRDLIPEDSDVNQLTKLHSQTRNQIIFLPSKGGFRVENPHGKKRGKKLRTTFNRKVSSFRNK